MVEVGTMLTDPKDISSLPHGSVIKYQGTEGTRVRSFTGWINERGEYLLDHNIEVNRWIVDRVGESLPDSLDRYKQRFRTAALGASWENSIAIPPVIEAMRALGIEQYATSLGMSVHPGDRELMESLPNGSICSYGASSQWSHFGLWRLDSNEWTRLTGRLPRAIEAMTLISVPAGTVCEAWATEPAPAGSVRLIREFKKRAWELGNKARDTNGWCGEYGRAMERLDINNRTGTGYIELPAVGETFHFNSGDDSMPDFPVGATIAGGDPAISLMRTQDGWEDVNSNPCTEDTIGNGDYEVTGLPDIWVGKRLTSLEEMEAVPVGATICASENISATTYTRVSGDRPWSHAGTTYRHENFSHIWASGTPLYISTLPEMVGETFPYPVGYEWEQSGDSTDVGDALPIGSQILRIENNNTRTKVSDGYWNRNGTNVRFSRLSGPHRVVRVGPEVIRPAVGQVLTVAMAQSLPLGAIVRSRNEQGAMNYYRRQETDFPGGVVGVVSGRWPGPTAFSDQRVTLVWDGEGEMSIGISSTGEVDELPVGTVVRIGMETVRWVKGEEGWKIQGNPAVTARDAAWFSAYIDGSSFNVVAFPVRGA